MARDGSGSARAVPHCFDNLPTARVETRAKRLGAYPEKRIARREFQKGDTLALVGHSTGGLDIRRVVRDLAANAKGARARPFAVDGAHGHSGHAKALDTFSAKCPPGRLAGHSGGAGRAIHSVLELDRLGERVISVRAEQVDTDPRDLRHATSWRRTGMYSKPCIATRSRRRTRKLAAAIIDAAPVMLVRDRR